MPRGSVDRLIDPLQWKCFCCSAHYVTACNKTRLLLDFSRCILSLKYTDTHTYFPLSTSARALPAVSSHAGRPTFLAKRRAAGGPDVQGVCVFMCHVPSLFFRVLGNTAFLLAGSLLLQWEACPEKRWMIGMLLPCYETKMEVFANVPGGTDVCSV